MAAASLPFTPCCLPDVTNSAEEIEVEAGEITKDRLATNVTTMSDITQIKANDISAQGNTSWFGFDWMVMTGHSYSDAYSYKSSKGKKLNKESANALMDALANNSQKYDETVGTKLEARTRSDRSLTNALANTAQRI
eukprot:TRINITY_DN32756_c0_g1_i1.p1 TRINITY_DN32756_c0_g1~~TRINITY_DN32756_c0_g1_i1.p1  ORF type:complete len:137 (-),score=20.17 TRINITY_DN32756_c0_g1_i1:115-525(-)